MSDRDTCPKVIVEAGAAMMHLRCLAEHMEQMSPWVRAKLYAATDYMVAEHNAARMEVGKALAAVADLEGAHGRIMAAHAEVAAVLDKYEIARPTNKQLTKAMKADPGPVVNEGGGR